MEIPIFAQKTTVMNKRQIVGTIILLVLAGIGIYNRVSSTQTAGTNTKGIYLHEEGQVHGTYYHITYETTDGKSLQQEYEDEFKQFDLSVSAFNDSSIISRINRNDTTARVDDYFRTVFTTAEKVSEKTDGAFDMTVAPLVNAWGFGFKHNTTVNDSTVKDLLQHIGYKKIKLVGDRVVKSDTSVMLDASAIAKGYSSDVAAQLLEKHGVKNYMVEIGGECVVKGINEKGRKWHLGITKPVDDSLNKQDELQSIIEIGIGGIATSGNYRRFYYKDGKKYAHTIDPKTGYPAEHNLLSTTIYGPTCIEADAYATACMVIGLEKAVKLIESIPELEGYFIYANSKGEYETTCTTGFKKLIAVE